MPVAEILAPIFHLILGFSTPTVSCHIGTSIGLTRFCSAHASDQKTRRRATQRHVCNNRPHLMLGVRGGLITRPVEHQLQCIRQASTGQATQQAMGSRMADCLHLRRKFGWNMKGLVFDFTLYMIHSIAVYVLICWKSLCYSI